MSNLKALAYELRENTIDIIVEGKAGHIGGDMSVMEILTELYFEQMNISPENMDDPDRDKFVMSKGHSMEAYYAVLAEKGFFPLKEVIGQFSKFGSKYIGHPNNKLPGIEMNSGSLGHGLPVCVGMALAAKMNGQSCRTYTVMGDGELACYTVISIVVFTLTFDWVLYGGNSAKLVYIISTDEKSALISDRILKELDIGATYVDGEGAYTGNDKRIIMCAVKNFLYPKLRDIVKDADPEAFMIVSSAKEIYGEGYKNHNDDDL